VHTCTGTLSSVHAVRSIWGSRGVALLFLDHGTIWGCGVSVTSGRSLPPGKTRYPLYRRLGGHQGRLGQLRKISPPTGIRSPDRPARSSVAIKTELPRPTSQEVKKVKCTLVQALRLCTGRTAHRGSRGIALLFLDHGTGRGCGVRCTLVQALRLCTGRTAHRGSRGIALLFLDHGTRRG